MKQLFVRRGRMLCQDSPAPTPQEGMALVRVHHSCISPGTELSSLKKSAWPLWKRALKEPHHARKAFQKMKDWGILRTYQMVQAQLAHGKPVGYSASGVVLSCPGILDIQVGDRVACAGAQYAHHAEFIVVPRQLLVRVPETVSDVDAATVTLGAIALQGIRRLAPTLGESIMVIGLGALGLLTVQMLRAQGCKVLAIDPDPSRKKKAQALGALVLSEDASAAPIAWVLGATQGYGVDGVMVTASTSSNEPMHTAFQVCRKKGRVVLVGDVGLHLSRSDFYEKEIDVLMSCSYGPGRYDPSYEEGGLDYPLPYVRWTENRNMQAYLSLLADGLVQVRPLIDRHYALEQAQEAYAAFEHADPKPILSVFDYPHNASPETLMVFKACPHAPSPRHSKVESSVRIGLIGAGQFAERVHLPHLKKMSDAVLQAVCSHRGERSAQIAQQYDALYATTSEDTIFSDPEIDAVMITSRHHLHAQTVLRALESGKHVFVEKPLALHWDEYKAIEALYQKKYQAQGLRLVVGFNRRFSPHLLWMQKKLASRQAPLMMHYHVNAGSLPADHWVRGSEGGGRHLGEACHFYDVFHALISENILHIQTMGLGEGHQALNIQDAFSIQLSFADGSIASLMYSPLGHSDAPKEILTVHCQGSVLTLHDYRTSICISDRTEKYTTRQQAKGHFEILEYFIRAIRDPSFSFDPDFSLRSSHTTLLCEQALVRSEH